MQLTLPTNRPLAASFLSFFSPATAPGLFCLLTRRLAWGWLVVLSAALLGATPTLAQTYNPNGITRAGSPTSGTAANQLNAPVGVFVDGTGNIYVADQSNHRIQKFPPTSTNGTNGTTVAGTGASGTAANRLSSPNGVYVDGTGNIYVADNSNHRIQKFPPNSTNGTNGSTVAGTGTAGSAANELNQAYGVYVDGTGNIFVVDIINNRIQKFPPTSTNGTNGSTVAGTGTAGSAANQLDLPSGVFVDGTGNIYVGDRNNNRIQQFLPTSTNGTNGSTVAGTGAFGSAADQLRRPQGVFVDGTGNIYVVDVNNHRIQQFAPVVPSLTTSASPNPSCTPTSVASVTVSGGTPAYSYTWVAPAGVVITAGGSTSSASVSANAGVTGVQTLTINVSDAASQTATAQVSLTFNAPPANPSLVAGGTLSCGQTVSLTATTSSAGSFTYAFAGPGLSSPNATAGTATASAGGLYSMTVTNLATGCTASTTATVQTSTAVVSVTLVSSHTLTCAQTSATLTAQATGIGSLTYAFTGGVLAGTPGSASTIVVSQGGTYTVLVTAANGCTASTTATVVSNTATPTVSLGASNTLTCAATTATLSATANGTGSLTYTFRGGALAGTPSTASAVTVSQAGTYTVTVSDATGCTNSATATVQSNTAAPTVNLGASNTLTCAMTTATLAATAGSGLPAGAGSLTYTFTGPGLPGTPSTASTVAVSQGGTYTVLVTDVTGCTNSTTALVQQDPAVVTASLGVSNTLTCALTMATLTAQATGPGSLTYAFTGGVLAGTPGSASTIAVSQGGTYTVLVTAANGCTASTTATVQSNTALASFTVLGSGTATCTSSPTVTLAGSEVGVNYQLRRDGVNTGGVVPGTGSALSFGPQSLSGVYTVLATNPTTSCTLTMAQSATVESNATPVSVSLGVSGTLTCAQTSVTLTAQTGSGLPAGAGSLTYAFTGGALAGTPGSASTAAVSQGGTYMVRVTAGNGCTNTATASVQSNTTAPAVSIGTSAASFGCGVSSITLTANVPTGATYAWEDGSNNSTTRVVSASGTYGLSAMATNGCSATATSVTLGTGGGILPTVTMVFNNQSTVVAGAGTATITVPGTPGQQFQVFGGSSFEYGSTLDRTNGYEIRQVESNGTGIFTIQRGGPFTIIVRDATGCSRTVQGEIVVK